MVRLERPGRVDPERPHPSLADRMEVGRVGHGLGCGTGPMLTRVRCPACRREVEWGDDNPCRPFCSERCRTLDLSGWLTERYRIPEETEEPESATPGNGGGEEQ